MKTFSLLFLILFCPSVCLGYQIHVDSVSVVVGKNKYRNLYVTIYNDTPSSLWIWLDKEKYDSDEVAIRRFFMKPRGDFSLYWIATDPNLIYNNKQAYNCDMFLKLLATNDSFTFIFWCLEEHQNDFHQMQTNNLNSIHISSFNQINLICPGMNEEKVQHEISYNYDYVVLPTVR